MVGCRGTVTIREVNGEILAKILERCPKFYRLDLKNTLVKSLEFYRILARLDDRLKSFTVLNPTTEGMLCYLRTRAEVHHKHTGSLNGEIKDVKDMIALISQNTDAAWWSLVLTD
jgi:hypothetical protein